jgi:hypothetical protein
MTEQAIKTKTPIWLMVTAGLGVLWNAYGLYQFIGSFSQTKESLMTVGMTAAQAELYLSLPVWITVVFAVGVVGGMAGSVALLMKKAIAYPIFTASLVGYIFLFAGDFYYGVFDNIPSQLAILIVVVAIAAALLAATAVARRKALLD